MSKNISMQEYAEDQDSLETEDFQSVKEAEERVSSDRKGRSMINLQIFISKQHGHIKNVGYVILNLLIITYFILATLHWIKKTNGYNFEWCNGYGLLVLILAFSYFGIFYKKVFKKFLKNSDHRSLSICRTAPLAFNCLAKINKERFPRLSKSTVFGSVILISFLIFIILDTAYSRNRLISFIGVGLIIGFGLIFSKHPTKVNWRTVIWGLILQFSFGIITIRWNVGRAIFQCLSKKVEIFLSFAQSGASFVFSEQLVNNGVFAFSALPVIFFFSFVIQILYYWGIMQCIIQNIGWTLHAFMGTTVCESINSAANTFLGMTESPLLIKPYIGKLTRSEIHAIMCSGFATVSGTVMAAYIRFGANPAHLITASVMSAPAALCFSKLFYPETEKSATTFKNISLEKSQDTSVIDAATKGALAGIPIILGVIANIIAFVSVVAFLNSILSWFGALVGYEQINFEWLLSKAFIPLSWVIGVPWSECEDVATLIGLKTVVNEFVAYQKLGEMKRESRLSPRTEAIATYAICGFANPSSIGIMIGGLSILAPEKRQEITDLAVRAFVAGSAVCFLTAGIAGTLMDDNFFNGSATNPDNITTPIPLIQSIN